MFDTKYKELKAEIARAQALNQTSMKTISELTLSRDKAVFEQSLLAKRIHTLQEQIMDEDTLKLVKRFTQERLLMRG